jgi:hypothetical protein
MIQPEEMLKNLAQDASVRLRVRSALNPLLWLCAIVSLGCFGFAICFSGVLRVLLVATGITPIVFTCLVGGYFAIKNPEKLQSEDYQLRKQALELIQQKGTRFDVEATSVDAIANPQVRSLPESTETDSQ